jgi:hypothetical protein
MWRNSYPPPNERGHGDCEADANRKGEHRAAPTKDYHTRDKRFAGNRRHIYSLERSQVYDLH